MLKYIKQINTRENILYNNILSLSRNKLFFTKFDLTDTFQNRIYLIFLHISFFICFGISKKKLTNKSSGDNEHVTQNTKTRLFRLPRGNRF